MMPDDCIISEWARVRRNEMVDIPDKLDIHPDFLKEADHHSNRLLSINYFP